VLLVVVLAACKARKEPQPRQPLDTLQPWDI
jgi:hypothetical protein